MLDRRLSLNIAVVARGGEASPMVAEVRDTLTARGHRVVVQEPSEEFGGAQMIVIHSSGALMTGADPRREAYAIVW